MGNKSFIQSHVTTMYMFVCVCVCIYKYIGLLKKNKKETNIY